MLRVAAGEFSARGLQVDALAATALAHGAATSGSDAEAVGSAADEEDGELALVAVARSQLEGNRWGGGVALLDGGSLEQLCALQLDAGVGALAWCGRERDVLACACDDGDVRLLRLSTDVDFALVPLVGARVENAGEDADASAGEDGWGHDDVVTGLSASAADKTKLASCSWDLTVKLWEIDASASHVATFEGHTDLVWGVAMHPTTAPTLASAAQDRTVVVWDSRRPHAASMLFKTKTPAFAVDWHPRKDYVCAVGLEDGTVLTYDTRAPKQPLNQLAVHGGAIHTVKYSSYHEDLLATGSDDATVALITDSCTPNAKVAEVSSSPTTSPEHAAHSDYVRGLTWYAQRDPIASDRRRPLALLATGSWDKMVRAWRSDEFAYQSLLERAL